MRQKRFLLCTLLYLTGVTQCQDETDDVLADYLNALPQNSIITTESDEELNLDPYTEQIVKVTSESSSQRTDNVIECRTEKGEPGICVAKGLCELGKGIIEDGYTLIDTRSNERCYFMHVCCLQSQVSKLNSTKLSFEDDKLINSQDRTSPGDATELPATTSPVSAGKCGFSNPTANIFASRDGSTTRDRVYADFGEFPWMVAILKRSMDTEWKKSNYIGGGSLIHPSVVMTTAVKVVKRKAKEIIIRAGEYDTNSEDELYEHQDKNVARIVVHPHFDRTSMLNAIALLILEEPVNLTDQPHIGIACLDQEVPQPGTICFGMGWGAENFANKSVYASILKKVKLPLIKNSQCETSLRKTHFGPFFQLHESLVCAGGKKRVDTCKGDGGAPLVCPLGAKDKRFAIYGMVAYGIGCGDENLPGVYVKVPQFYNWVGQQLSMEDMDLTSYTIA